MPTSNVTLPTGECLPLAFAGYKDGDAGLYLNNKKMDKMPASYQAANYRSKIWRYQIALITAVESLNIEFDAIICAKSNDEDAGIYYSALKERNQFKIDLTNNLGRKGEKRSWRPETTVDDMIN